MLQWEEKNAHAPKVQCDFKWPPFFARLCVRARVCLCVPAFTVRLHIGNLLVDHDYKLPEHSNAFIIESQLNVYDIVLNALVRVRLTDTHAHVHELRQLCYGFTASTERTILKGCHTA